MAEYAARLKAYANKGKCGMPELEMTGRRLEYALQELCDRVERANGSMVMLIGAGVSTAAGVPDFRGPSGVWTKELAAKASKKEKKRTRDESSESAWVQAGTPLDLTTIQPTLTHHALVELARRGVLKCLISQNIDGLEQRAGFPRDKLAVIHGCVCKERCALCGARYLRSSDVGGKSNSRGFRTRIPWYGFDRLLRCFSSSMARWRANWPPMRSARLWRRVVRHSARLGRQLASRSGDPCRYRE